MGGNIACSQNGHCNSSTGNDDGDGSVDMRFLLKYPKLKNPGQERMKRDL